MEKAITKIIAAIFLGIVYGLLIKYTNKDVAIICLLIQIYLELLFKNEVE